MSGPHLPRGLRPAGQGTALQGHQPHREPPGAQQQLLPVRGLADPPPGQDAAGTAAKGEGSEGQGVGGEGSEVPNNNYCLFEDWLTPILDRMLQEQREQVRGQRVRGQRVEDQRGQPKVHRVLLGPWEIDFFQ